MTQGNLPQTGYSSSDEPVRELFDAYYTEKLEFPSNDVDAVLAYFGKRGFGDRASASIASTLLQQAKLDDVPVFKLLDTLKGLNDSQLSGLVAEILNYTRGKTSSLGFQVSAENNIVESRNIEVFED
jgi:pyridoxal/pyridoxine/pyridoxamine kinase